MKTFFSKMRGSAQLPPRMATREIAYALIGCLIGIGVCGYLSSRFFESRDLTLMIGSMGASAVLVYGAIKSPFAQPRNLIGGHIISGLVGVTCFYGLSGNVLLASAVAVSFATAAMALTRTVHPPGGATALIAVIGGEKIHHLGFLYPLVPAGAGALVLLIIGLIVNNIPGDRRYPEYWW